MKQKQTIDDLLAEIESAADADLLTEEEWELRQAGEP